MSLPNQFTPVNQTDHTARCENEIVHKGLNVVNQVSINSHHCEEGILDDIVAKQKKYFMMYINNKSLELATNLESDVKKIIYTCVETEMKNLINKQINEFKENIENNIEMKLQELKSETIKLQMTMYQDITEYFDSVLHDKIQESVKKLELKNYDSSVVDSIDTNLTTDNDNDNDNNNNSEIIMKIQDDKENIQNKYLIEEIKKSCQEIEDLKQDIVDQEKLRIIIELNELQQTMSKSRINKNSDKNSDENINSFTADLSSKVIDASQRIGRNVSENIAMTLRVNKYCTFLLTTMLGIFVASQFI